MKGGPGKNLELYLSSSKITSLAGNQCFFPIGKTSSIHSKWIFQLCYIAGLLKGSCLFCRDKLIN